MHLRLTDASSGNTPSTPLHQGPDFSGWPLGPDGSTLPPPGTFRDPGKQKWWQEPSPRGPRETFHLCERNKKHRFHTVELIMPRSSCLWLRNRLSIQVVTRILYLTFPLRKHTFFIWGHFRGSLLCSWSAHCPTDCFSFLPNMPYSPGTRETALRTCVLSCFSCVRPLVTSWTIACQAPLSMGFSRQGYWSGLPCPPPESRSERA